MRVDESLIEAAQLKATGANVHKVNQMIGAYRSSCLLSEAQGIPEVRQAFWEADAVWRERKLRDLLKHPA